MRLQVDNLFGMTIFFAIALVMFLLTYVFVNSILQAPSFQKSVAMNNPTSNAIVTHGIQTFTSINTILAFLYIFIGIASVIAAAFTDTSPVFAVVAIVLLPIEIYVAFVYHDAFFNIIQNSSVFGGIANQYPAILTIFQYYPLITLIISILLIIVTFGKG